nr:hypothetical protein [uncultured Draconibacterium sp.]
MKRADFIKAFAQCYNGDAQSLETKLSNVAGMVFDALSFKSEDTAANIEAIGAPGEGDVYRVTAAGTLNVGGKELAVVAKDIVRYDDAEWVKVVNIA